MKREVFRCSLPECSRTSMGFYPKRPSVAAKMSEYKYCSPAHQQKHWRQRTRYQRLGAKPLRFCRLCGDRIEPSLRPGRPRKYCSPAHATAAANKRRPPRSSEVAMLEEAVQTADEAAREGWAALDKAKEAETEARRKVDALLEDIRSNVAEREAALAEAVHQAEADHQERQEAAKAALNQAEAALAEAIRQAEADHQESHNKAQTTLDQAEADYQERHDEALTALDQAQAALTEARQVAMERLATEKRDLVEQFAALQEQGGFSLGRRRVRKRIARRLEEIETQDIEESLEVEAEIAQTARDALSAIAPPRSVEAETKAVELARDALSTIEPPRSVEAEEKAVELARETLSTIEPPRSVEAEEKAVELARDALNRIPEKLDVVVQMREAYQEYLEAKTQEEKYGPAARVKRLLERVKAVPGSLEHLEWKMKLAEQERAAAQEKAEALSQKVERAVAVLTSTRKRLAHRAAAARRRRAMAAGVEPETKAPPEVQNVLQVNIERARRDPDYAAWLRRQSLL